MPGFTYGPLNLIDVVTREYKSEAVYNGADYIYTAHELSGTATVHPRLVTDSLQPTGYATGVDAVAGLQAAFLQPRQALEFDVGTVPFDALSPSSDVQNGPEPLFFSAVQVYGQKTIIAYFGIRWYTVLEDDTDPPPITSNRWTMSHEYDDQFRLTIVTHGLATFRRDALLTWGTNADDYRRWLFVPVPVGFRRDIGPVVLAQDGLSIDYTTKDVTVPQESPDTSVAHLAMKSQVVTDAPGLYDIERSLLGGVAIAAGAGEIAHQRNVAGGGRGLGIPPIGALGLAAVVAGGIGAVLDRLPRSILTVTVTAFGTPLATAQDMYTVCLAVMKAKYTDQGNPGAFISTAQATSHLSAVIDHDLRVCQLIWEVILPPSIAGGVGVNPQNPTNLDQAVSTFLVSEELKDSSGNVLYGDSRNNKIAKGPGQASAQQERFGYIGDDVMETLLAQALQPAAPDLMTVNPPTAPDVTTHPVALIDPPEGR